LIAALILGASGCEEEEGQCAGLCISATTLRLYRSEWADGEHELIVRYPRYDGVHEVRCLVDLPMVDPELRCEGDGEHNGIDPQWVFVSVDATVNVRVELHERGDFELELVPPEGEALTKVVRPVYSEHEFCGQVCVTANELINLEE
jgi:hypothetical protein